MHHEIVSASINTVGNFDSKKLSKCQYAKIPQCQNAKMSKCQNVKNAKNAQMTNNIYNKTTFVHFINEAQFLF